MERYILMKMMEWLMEHCICMHRSQAVFHPVASILGREGKHINIHVDCWGDELSSMPEQMHAMRPVVNLGCWREICATPFFFAAQSQSPPQQ